MSPSGFRVPGLLFRVRWNKKRNGGFATGEGRDDADYGTHYSNIHILYIPTRLEIKVLTFALLMFINDFFEMLLYVMYLIYEQMKKDCTNDDYI